MAEPVGPSRSQLAVLRVIGVAMGAGLSLFAIVSWILRRDAAARVPAGSVSAFVNGWILLTAITVITAIVVWRRTVAPRIEGPAQTPLPAGAPALQTAVIIVWALIEVASLFGVIAYFLTGNGWTGGPAVAVFWIALAVTWPRSHWLQNGRSDGRSPLR